MEDKKDAKCWQNWKVDPKEMEEYIKKCSVVEMESRVEKTDRDYTTADESTKRWVQYVVAFVASLLMAVNGFHFGWPAPTLIILQDHEKSPIPITSSEGGWICSALFIGSIFGPLLGRYLSDHYGRKIAMLSCIFPNIVTFVIIFFATDVYMLYTARFIAGIASGIIYLNLPIYITEISSPDVRGKLGILPGILFGVGILTEYCVIPHISIKMNAVMCLVVAVFQGISMFFLPETPYFHIIKKQDEKAKKSLELLRQTKYIKKEFENLKYAWQLQQEDKTSVLDIFKSRLNRKCLRLSFGVHTATQFSGTAAITSYTFIILKDANAPISTDLCGVILAFLNIFYAIFAALLVDRWGRKPLFISSASLAAVSLIALGTFNHFKETNAESVEHLALIPVCCLLLYLAAYNIGIGAIPFQYCSEIFATKFTATAITMMTMYMAVASLVVTKFYQVIGDTFGMSYCFWMFGVICTFSTVFFIVFIPETKGKSLEQIQIELESSVE